MAEVQIGDFVQHVISQRCGFVVDVATYYVLVVPMASHRRSSTTWGTDRIGPASRKPTAEEWAKFCAYQLTEG